MWQDGVASHVIAAAVGCSASGVRDHAMRHCWPRRASRPEPREGRDLMPAAIRYRCPDCLAVQAVRWGAVCGVCGHPPLRGAHAA
jgi:hypothetical protein